MYTKTDMERDMFLTHLRCCHFINNKRRSLTDTHTAQVFQTFVTLTLCLMEVSDRDNGKWELVCLYIKHTQPSLIV